jgi:DNA-binding LacI/PurR family transcriptional regulator
MCLGGQVPEDLCVIGIDNSPVAHATSPGPERGMPL